MFRNIKAKNMIFLLNFKMYIFNILIKENLIFINLKIIYLKKYNYNIKLLEELIQKVL